MNGHRVSNAALGLVLVFLLGPFLVVVIAAFGGDQALVFPPRTWSTRWIAQVFGMADFRAAFFISLWLGLLSALLALLLGIPAAYALARFRLPGHELITSVLTAPVIIPGIVVGLALLRYLVVIWDLPVSAGLLLGHTALLIPYAVRVVAASLANLRIDIEDAAVTLGAGRARVFFSIVLPNIRNGIAAAFVLAFITSFDQVPVSLFLTGPGVSTLPIQMLIYIQYSFDPSIAALSALLGVFAIVLVFVTERTLGLSRFM